MSDPGRAAKLKAAAILGSVVLVAFVTVAVVYGVTGSGNDGAADPIATGVGTPTSLSTSPAETTTTLPSTSTSTATKTESSNTPTHERPAGAPEGLPADVQEATVARIVDGDTLELSAVAAGAALGSTQQVDVRLLEIDTPETKDPNEPVQCYGAEATSRLGQLAPPGSSVWVQRDEELRDQYGRYLLYLWTGDGTFVNLTLVEEGYAQATLYQPNDLHWDTISAAEHDARGANDGLWAACSYFGAPGTTPPQQTAPPQPRQAPTGDGPYLFPPPPPDLDCGGVSATDFRVRPGDPHRFDRDGDGIGCES